MPPDGEPNIHNRGLVAAIVASVVLGGTPEVGLGTRVLAAAPASARVPAHLALLVAAIRGPALAADVSSRLDGISVSACGSGARVQDLALWAGMRRDLKA